MGSQPSNNLAPSSKTISGSFRWAYVQTADKWSGCDWPTSFGRAARNLMGLRAAQASLLAEATGGEEAADWLAAAAWLSHVERDAKQAAARAAKAAELAEAGKFAEALQRADEACAIEGCYHANLVWQTLRAAIATALKEQNG